MADRAPPYEAAIATAVVALAGFVDAIAFLALRHDLVSAMSGNLIRGGVDVTAIGLRVPRLALTIGSFLAGVVLGAVIGTAAGNRRRPVVLCIVTGLIAAAAARAIGGPREIVLIVVPLAMLNMLSADHGRPGTPVTYVTGTLVRLGENIVRAARGEDVFGWAIPLIFVAAFSGGVLSGAVTCRALGLAALWPAAILSLSLCVVTVVLDRH